MQNILYIIGNGFDLEHCLATKYSDFRSYLLKNRSRYGELISLIESYYPEIYANWSNFEDALGKVSDGVIFKQAEVFCEDLKEEDNIEHILHMQEDVMDINTDTIKNKLGEAFSEWVEQISLNGIQPLFLLDQGALYLTMNYTKTLEDVYNIEDKHILHIHGIQNSDIIFGHGKTEFKSTFRDDEKYVITDFAEDNARNLFDLFKKPVESVICVNDAFFQGLKGAVNVIKIIGHSLSDVDMPYFERIFQEVGNSAEWIIYYHGEETESEPKKKKLIDIGILEQNIHIESQKNILNT